MAYSTPNGDMNIINNDGAGAHKLASVGGIPFWLSWSPDGGTIRFEKDDTLWEMASAVPTLPFRWLASLRLEVLWPLVT